MEEYVIELELFTAEPREQVKRLHRYLKEYGTVYNTVSRGVEVSSEVIILDPVSISFHERRSRA